MKLFAVLCFSIFLISCSGGENKSSATIIEVIQEECKSEGNDLLWKTFYIMDEEKVFLDGSDDSEDFEKRLYKNLETSFPQWFTEENKELSKKFISDYRKLYQRMAKIQKESKYELWAKVIGQIELEIPNETTTDKEIQEINALVLEASHSLGALPARCAPAEKTTKTPDDDFGTEDGEPDEKSFVGRLKKEHHPLVYGAKKVFLTAYQDCRIEGRVQAFDRQTEPVQGILRLEQGHENGIGGKRIIEDADLLYNTHHYYGFRPGGGRSLASLDGGQDQCLDQKSFLMIYDYGGKPATYSSSNSSLNMFRHAVDSASPDLGMDCSGFVFSALATAGLRLHPKKQVIASQVYAVGAENFRRASSSVMPCLQKVKMTQKSNLKNGDIISTPRHTMIVDRVGEDPLAIEKYYWKNKCDDITYKDFDFETLQSNGVKGGIGIHRMRGEEHLRISKSMRLPLEALARSICNNAKKGKKTLSRLNLSGTNYKVSIVRHENTPECKGREVSLTAESCLNECN